jgi:hypothetical protein
MLPTFFVEYGGKVTNIKSYKKYHKCGIFKGKPGQYQIFTGLHAFEI